jgi:hypothetical protein
MMQDYNYKGLPGFGANASEDGSNDLYDPSDYDIDEEDESPEANTSIDEVIEWLEGQGYQVSRDDFVDEDEDAVDESDKADTPRNTQPLSELEERFVDAYRSAGSDSERSQLVLDYNRIKEGLHTHELNMVRAEPYIPQVEEQFEASGLPPAAARDYVQLLLASGNATNPEVQKHAMAMAVGRHTLFDLHKGPLKRTTQVQLPGGEAPGGGSALSGDLGSVLESQLKRNFPGIALTPALKRELKEQGIL